MTENPIGTLIPNIPDTEYNSLKRKLRTVSPSRILPRNPNIYGSVSPITSIEELFTVEGREKIDKARYSSPSPSQLRIKAQEATTRELIRHGFSVNQRKIEILASVHRLTRCMAVSQGMIGSKGLLSTIIPKSLASLFPHYYEGEYHALFLLNARQFAEDLFEDLQPEEWPDLYKIGFHGLFDRSNSQKVWPKIQEVLSFEDALIEFLIQFLTKSTFTKTYRHLIKTFGYGRKEAIDMIHAIEDEIREIVTTDKATIRAMARMRLDYMREEAISATKHAVAVRAIHVDAQIAGVTSTEDISNEEEIIDVISTVTDRDRAGHDDIMKKLESPEGWE